jgi:threonine dehydrogenase-like Zn-dependent dehydrogenase
MKWKEKERCPMLAVVVVEPGRVELAELPQPSPGPYEARIKTEVACLCNATDGKLIGGHFPGVDTYPLTLGHESVGIVDAVGQKVRNFRVGDRVIGGLLFDAGDGRTASGWGGFCEYTLAADHDAMVADGVADAEHGWFEVYEIQRVVPPEIPVEAAVMLCTWREVYGGIGDFHLQPGNDLLVFGAGPVGLSFLRFGRLLGLGRITLVDPLEAKRERAAALGADAVLPPDEQLLRDLVASRGKPFDAVIDAVGSPAIVNMALPLIGMGGTIGIYGVIAEPVITINKGQGPYNFNLFMHQWPTRWRERAAQEPLCDWIRAGTLRAEEFITHEFPIRRVNEAIEAVRSGQVIKTILRYD